MGRKNKGNSQNGSNQQNGHANGTTASTANGTSNGGLKQNGLSNGHSNGVSNGRSIPKTNSQRGPTTETASSSRSTGSDTIERRNTTDNRQRNDHSCQVDLLVEEDLVEKFARLREWRKMETLGELVALLTPVQRDLLDAMLRGSTGPTKQVMDTYERRVNNPRSMETVTTWDPLERQRELFMPALSRLTPCNRQCAMVMMRQLHTFINAIPSIQLGKNEDAVQSETEQILTMVVTALHHPAFSVDSQMELVKMRNDLKRILQELIPYTQCQSKESPKPTIKSMRCLDFNQDTEEAVIELLWTDGVVTYASRSGKQLHEMHMRLLDSYGQESRENYQRIVPYFPRIDNFLIIQDYIEKLSNLPARMLTDERVAEEFRDTRQTSSEVASTPVAHAPSRRQRRIEETDEMEYRNDRSLGVLPMVRVPSLPPPSTAPSCPYCADEHLFSTCPHIAVKAVYINGVCSPAAAGRSGPVWDTIRCSCCPP